MGHGFPMTFPHAAAGLTCLGRRCSPGGTLDTECPPASLPTARFVRGGGCGQRCPPDFGNFGWACSWSDAGQRCREQRGEGCVTMGAGGAWSSCSGGCWLLDGKGRIGTPDMALAGERPTTALMVAVLLRTRIARAPSGDSACGWQLMAEAPDSRRALAET